MPGVPINGFCVLSEPALPNSFHSLLPVEFSHDAYTDVLAFKPGTKFISTFRGSGELTFRQSYRGTILYDIRNLVVLPRSRKKHIYFAGVSRSAKTVFTFYLSKWGTPKGLQSRKLDSYPEGISASDCDGDGVTEIMVFGPSFQGIRVYKPFEKFKIIWKEDNGVFSHAVFTDLDQDGYDDIAAYELKSGKVNFFINNSRGEFRFTRAFRLGGYPEQLAGIDINADGYNDLLIRYGNTLEIFAGDSISSFYTRHSINLIGLTRFIYGDFNRDGKFDIASLNKKSGGITVYFQMKDFEFYNGLNYFYGINFTEIKPFYSRFINGVLTIGDSGVKIIHNFRSIFEKKPFIFPLTPIKIKKLDINRDKIDDLCFLDSSGTFLDIVQRGRNGIPQFIHRISTGVRITDFLSYYIDRKEQRLLLQVEKSSELLICDIDINGNKNNFTSIFFDHEIKSISLVSLLPDVVSMPVIFLRSDSVIQISLPGRRESSNRAVLPYSISFEERYCLVGDDVVSISVLQGSGIRLRSYNLTTQKNTENYYTDFSVGEIFTVYPWEAGENSFVIFAENKGSVLAFLGDVTGSILPIEFTGEGKEIFINSGFDFSISGSGNSVHYAYSHKTSKIYRFALLKKKRSLVCSTVTTTPYSIIDFVLTYSSGNIAYILSIDGKSPKVHVNRG